MFPKISLLAGPTPLVELRNLPQYLGCKARIFIKCDDMAPMGGAGNKLRKLEYLVAEAIEQGADTLVTTGGLQSNHARLTAAVAARCGLRCELVLSQLVPQSSENYTNNGNVLLMRNFGAKLHVLDPGQDAKTYARTLLQGLRTAGHKPYFIPFGGSSVQGALGYVGCAREIERQLAAQNMQADLVFCTTGSGGTQAGLVAGFALSGSHTQVRGISVLHPQNRMTPVVSSLANGILLTLRHTPLPLGIPTVHINADQIGNGYGIPSPSGLEAIQLLGRTEGIMLDPVYTGKAFAGLLAAARQEQWSAKTTVVFVHSGGAPGLYAYAETMADYLQQAEQLHPSLPLPAAPASAAVRLDPEWADAANDANGPSTVIDGDDAEEEDLPPSCTPHARAG